MKEKVEGQERECEKGGRGTLKGVDITTYIPDIVVGRDVQFSEPPCSASQCILLQVVLDGQSNVFWQDGVQQPLLCGSRREECSGEAQHV